MKVITLSLLPAKEERDEFHILKGDVYFHDVAHILNSHQQMKVISLSLLPTKIESDSQVLIRPPWHLRNCDLK